MMIFAFGMPSTGSLIIILVIVLFDLFCAMTNYLLLQK